MLNQLKDIAAGMKGPKGSVQITHPITGEVSEAELGGTGGDISVNWYHATFLHENLSGDLKGKFKPPAKTNHSIQVSKNDFIKAVSSLDKKPEETLVETPVIPETGE